MPPSLAAHLPTIWWVAIAPGVLYAAILFGLRRAAFSGPVLMATALALTLTWLTRRWDGEGLHVMPAAMVAISAVSIEEFANRPLRRAVACGLVMAAWTWATMLLVDVAGCVAEPACRLRDTGGAAWLDGLLLGPLGAFLTALLLACILGPLRRRREARTERDSELASLARIERASDP